jgi:hypothetical protein
MGQKLNWVEVLNLQTTWQSRAHLHAWFNELVGRPTNIIDGTVEGFAEALGFMRRSVANLRFDEPMDLLWLDTQLKTVSIGLLHHQGAQEGSDSHLPRCRSRVKGMLDSDLLRAVKDTLLIQFAEYVGDRLDGTSTYVVTRCEGLQRATAGNHVACEAVYPQELEQQWRQEIPLLRHITPATAELVRCSNLLASNGKSRFCTDECRFATFQLEKQVQEPGDIAVKQRRNRRREKQAE